MKRIFIDADKCDGCMNCSLACMNAHRKDGADNIYSLDLNDPENESRNFILQDGEKHYRPLLKGVLRCPYLSSFVPSSNGLHLQDNPRFRLSRSVCFWAVPAAFFHP